MPMAAYTLLDFRDPETVKDCKRICDSSLGGRSVCNLDYVPARGGEPAHMRFHGAISTEIPRDNLELHRSGYAAWRNRDRPPTIFGRSVWNIDPYNYIGLRVKSDGRHYHVNLQTDTVEPTDIHQHRLYARAPGKWETVLIQWHDFVRTNHGVVTEPQSEMMRSSLRSVGIGLIDRIVGPYDLSISRVWATNNPDGGLEDVEGISAEAQRLAEPPSSEKQPSEPVERNL